MTRFMAKFLDTPRMPPTFKGFAQESSQRGLSGFHTDEARAQAQDVGVIVLAAQAGVDE